MSHNSSSVFASPYKAPDYLPDNNGDSGHCASQLLIRLRPSLIYRRLLVIVTLLSLLAIFLVDIRLEFQLVPVLLLAWLLKLAWANNRSLDLHCNSQGEWQLHIKQQKLQAQLLADSVVMPLFAILQFKLEGAGRSSVVIFRDSLRHDDFRRLRVHLKVEGIQPVRRDTLGR